MEPRLGNCFGEGDPGAANGVAAYKEGLRLLAEGKADAELQKKTRRYIDRLETVLSKLPMELVLMLSSDNVQVETVHTREVPKGMSIQDAIEVDLAAMKEPAGSA